MDRESLSEALHSITRLLESRPAIPHDMSFLREKDDGIERLGFYVIFSLSLAHGSETQKFPQDFSEQGLQDESDNML